MIILLAIIHVVLFVTLIGNLVYLKKVGSSLPPDRWPSLTVFIPARNEEENLKRLLPSLLGQSYPDFQVVVYDDASTDNTSDVINSFAGPTLTGMRGEGPPDGWVGKVHALYQATRNATSDLYLFIDADGEFRHTGALSKLVQTLLAQPRNSVLTGLTRLKGGGRLLVSYVPFAIVATLPWFLSRKGPKNLGALNGQLWMIRAEDYNKFEPHKALANEILEDVQIGRYLHGHGIIPVLYNAQKDFNIYMYASFRDAWLGFKKNAYLIFGGTPTSFILTSFIYLLVFVFAPLFSVWFLLSIYLLKWSIDLLSGFGPFITLAAPIGFFLSFVIQTDSAIAHWRNRVAWKGRLVGSPPKRDANS